MSCDWLPRRAGEGLDAIAKLRRQYWPSATGTTRERMPPLSGPLSFSRRGQFVLSI